MTVLESECADVEGQIAKLQELLKTKRAQIAQLPPMQSLSDDIMYAIFDAAYLHDFPRCRLHTGELHDSPVVVTHVCRRWRRLALELPALWSCLHITPSQDAENPDALDAFLERSGNRDLSIIFICYHPDQYEVEGPPQEHPNDYRTYWPRYTSCLERLLKHSGRWKYCGFYIGNADQLEFLYEALQGRNFPSLQFLQMLVHYMADVPDEYFLDITAPNLQEFRGSITHTTGPSIYAGLTNLMLDNHPLSSLQLIHVLKALSSTLEGLTLRLMSIYGDPPSSSSTPLSLPRLRDLTIAEHINDNARGTHATRELLRSCPNLETFHCVNLSSFDIIVTPDPMIRYDRVHSLFMQHGYWADRNAYLWSQHINMFHAVQDVYIHDTYAMDCLAVLQGATVNAHVAWSGLQTLAISVRTRSDLGEVLAFLKHRVDIQHPVSSVTFLCSDIDRTDLEQHWEAGDHGAVVVNWRSTVAGYDPFDPWDQVNEFPTLKPWKGMLTFVDQDL